MSLFRRGKRQPQLEIAQRTTPVESASYEITFEWKEIVIYWEGKRGVVFPGAWGVDPHVTIVPDATSWDRRAPSWLLGRHDDVLARLRLDARHVVREERDDSKAVRLLEEVTR